MNEYKNLTDYMVLSMYEKSITAWRNRPRIMPINDRNYLLQRKEQLRSELVRRGLILT
jgi:hypothetical protein